MEFFTRFLRPDDAESLLSLNRELAAIPHGFVRNEEEMNLEFVEKTIERGVNGGIALGAFERGSGRLMGAITASPPSKASAMRRQSASFGHTSSLSGSRHCDSEATCIRHARSR